MAGLRMIEVAEQLLEKARREKVAWVKATYNDAYYVVLPDGMSLAITRLSWLSGPPPKPPGLPELPDLRKATTYGYRLDLFEDQGPMIAATAADPVITIGYEQGPMIGSLAATAADPEYTTLRGIYELAEGEGNNVQDKIRKALDYLKGAEEPPAAPKSG